MPLQPPGKHRIRARAFDKAGNSIEDNTELEILPIADPAITFINQDVFIGEGGLTIKGNSLASTTILLVFNEENGKPVFKNQVLTDENGSWQLVTDQPLKKGQYYFEIRAQDERGALSFPVKSGLVKVHERPLFTLGGWEVTQFWFFMGLLAILLAGFWAGWYFDRLWRKQVGRKILIAQRDVLNMNTRVKKDLDALSLKLADNQVSSHELAELKYLLKESKDRLEKMEKYVTENIEEIGE